MTIITDIDKDTYINYWLPLAYKHQDSKFVFYTSHKMPNVTIPKNVVIQSSLPNIDTFAFLTQKNLIPTYETMVYLENLETYKFINPKIQGTNEVTNSFTARNNYRGESAIEYSEEYDLRDNSKLTVYKV